MLDPKTQVNPLLAKVTPPILAGLLAAGYNSAIESDTNFQSMRNFAMYAGIAAGANFLGTTGVGFILPEFTNEKLKNVQHMVLGGAATALLNILGQATLQYPKDLRTIHNGIAGGIAGAASPMISSQVLSMF